MIYKTSKSKTTAVLELIDNTDYDIAQKVLTTDLTVLLTLASIDDVNKRQWTISHAV